MTATSGDLDPERAARVVLSRVGEPGDPRLTGLVAELGAETVLTGLREQSAHGGLHDSLAARLRQAGLPPRGELVAAMLDQKSVWDRMVERYAPNRHVADRILDNRFYQGISDSFVGSHEYAALEALYELHEEGEYDCVVVDTPPSRSALVEQALRLYLRAD